MSQRRTRTSCLRWAATVAIVAGLSGCGEVSTPGAQAEPRLAIDRASGPIRPFETDVPRLVVLGDSLTAGLGLEATEAYPARLQERLDAAGHHVQVVNAGVSGDTTAGGLRRLEWALGGGADVLIVALGGNDGLRGLPVDEMKQNLSQIISTAKALGVEVLLAGMEAPPNFGEIYTAAFRDVFSQLANGHDVALIPFLLEGVAGVPDLNQSDGIHPNADGASRVAEHIWPAVEPMVQRLAIGDGQ